MPVHLLTELLDEAPYLGQPYLTISNGVRAARIYGHGHVTGIYSKTSLGSFSEVGRVKFLMSLLQDEDTPDFTKDSYRAVAWVDYGILITGGET